MASLNYSIRRRRMFNIQGNILQTCSLVERADGGCGSPGCAQTDKGLKTRLLLKIALCQSASVPIACRCPRRIEPRPSPFFSAGDALYLLRHHQQWPLWFLCHFGCSLTNASLAFLHFEAAHHSIKRNQTHSEKRVT